MNKRNFVLNEYVENCPLTKCNLLEASIKLQNYDGGKYSASVINEDNEYIGQILMKVGNDEYEEVFQTEERFPTITQAKCAAIDHFFG